MKVEIAYSTISRLRGLLGRKECPDALLLTRCNDIHTFGMRHAIDVAFLAADGTVLEVYRGLGARCRVRCKQADSTLERLAEDTPWFERGDRVDLKRLVQESL